MGMSRMIPCEAVPGAKVFNSHLLQHGLVSSSYSKTADLSRYFMVKTWYWDGAIYYAEWKLTNCTVCDPDDPC